MYRIVIKDRNGHKECTKPEYTCAIRRENSTWTQIQLGVPIIYTEMLFDTKEEAYEFSSRFE